MNTEFDLALILSVTSAVCVIGCAFAAVYELTIQNEGTPDVDSAEGSESKHKGVTDDGQKDYTFSR